MVRILDACAFIKNIDFTGQSKPWTEEELRDFRKLMNELKAKNAKRKLPRLTARKKVTA